MVDRLLERLDGGQRCRHLRQLPVLAEFVAVQHSPLLDQSPRGGRQAIEHSSQRREVMQTKRTIEQWRGAHPDPP